MFWCLAFYVATLLSKVLLFSIMFRSLDRQPKFSVCLITTLVGFLIYDFFALILHTEFCSALWNYVHNVVFSNYVQQMAGASQDETHEQSWDECIFPRFP